MSGLIKRRIKMIRGLALMLVFILICGCATPPQQHSPYVVEPKVLPPVQFSSQYPPTVCVRPATSEEVKSITQFPEEITQFPRECSPMALAGVVAGLIVTSPVWFLLGPDLPTKAKPQGIDTMRKRLEEFPSQLREDIEQRFSVSSSGESSDLLEVIYLVGLNNDISSKEHQECFVLHAQVVLKSKGEEVFRDIIHIDPQTYSSDIQQPDLFPLLGSILNYGYAIIPIMIETRLPGLPWKSKELKANNEQPDEPQRKEGI